MIGVLVFDAEMPSADERNLAPNQRQWIAAISSEKPLEQCFSEESSPKQRAKSSNAAQRATERSAG
jgi:hypothetical protein